jgi:hypothetical protein
MAQILVPGTALVAMQGVFGVQPWTCVAHFKYDNLGDAWTQANITLLATTVNTAWGTRIAPLAHSEVILQNVEATDIGQVAPAFGSSSTAKPGTSTLGTPLTTATCMVVSRHISRRYRGGHPRIYLPIGVSGDVQTQDSWTQAFVTQSQQAWANLVSDVRTGIPAIGGNQVSEVIPAYTYTLVDDPIHHKWHRTRTGLLNTFIVQSYEARQTFGTQRRRLVQG